MDVTPIKNPIIWQSSDLQSQIQNRQPKIHDDKRDPRELDLLGAAMLRRDGWRVVGLHWTRGAGDNPIPILDAYRFAEREPMNRRRRRARRKGRDKIPAGHELSDRKLIASRVAIDDRIDRLAISGDPLRTLVCVKPRGFPSEILRWWSYHPLTVPRRLDSEIGHKQPKRFFILPP